jgi:hypothetical protein
MVDALLAKPLVCNISKYIHEQIEVLLKEMVQMDVRDILWCSSSFLKGYQLGCFLNDREVQVAF